MRDLDRRTFLRLGVRGAALAGLVGAWPAHAWAIEGAPDWDAIVGKAVGFLKARQGDDGSWSGDRNEPGITALVVAGLLRSGKVTPAEPTITKALAKLEQLVSPKGGLADSPHATYTTSVALMAFHEANKDGRLDGVIKGCQDFLKGTQYDETEGKGPNDLSYGGLGYGGGNSRPDLSNTSFFVDALRESGLPADDPALQKALVFVSRCQNLKSEFNDQPHAAEINDGGFFYTSGPAPAGGGPGGKAAAKKADTSTRSNAGMTYAGLKSMIYAGLTQDDVRVKAALGYIAKNYSLDENPGQGQRGLYYYYMTFGKAMAALGKPTFVDEGGKAHDWRAELIAALASRQDKNGGWANPVDRFLEGDPNIVTSYALIALAAARAPVK
ncbi:prenyltransferase/squalene oxidase repeat-containing protein [Isosphaeraceae bacterium EP7]